MWPFNNGSIADCGVTIMNWRKEKKNHTNWCCKIISIRKIIINTSFNKSITNRCPKSYAKTANQKKATSKKQNKTKKKSPTRFKERNILLIITHSCSCCYNAIAEKQTTATKWELHARQKVTQPITANDKICRKYNWYAFFVCTILSCYFILFAIDIDAQFFSKCFHLLHILHRLRLIAQWSV